ncbi:DNA cytosine methyltransferase [Pantoea agglomerans]|uniref:DNA cytosine methyltransferase n=1 Tax=Enterobacter agglomerans TaxID=549 RepID=UPI00178344E0|nr:DNA cytosine methyltransferase [Pantoea agglomerans]MBD8133832.1 DNA cytosine methyltransferase [Pantoea agglomerans]
MYRALSLFSGIGGLCEGVKLAGFEISGASEIDKYASENYRLNFPKIPLYEGDVCQFLVKGSIEYENQKDTYIGSGIDLIFGGPPCQGFSQIGPRDPLDPRNELYLQMCRLAVQFQPKVILIENVPNMILMKKGMFKDRIIKSLENCGYSNIGLLQLCADNYGIPQSRNRIFFIAVKDDFITESAQGLFESFAKHYLQPKVCVDEALSDLPELVAMDSGHVLAYPPKSSIISSYQKEMRIDYNGKLYSKSEKMNLFKIHEKESCLHNHHTKSVQERRAHIISILKPGAKADSLPKEIWNNKRPEKWRRFDGSKPAHTLLAHMHRDLSEWIHPKYNRWITVREAMRLQGFHDAFVLKTSEWQQLKQVGNAVPPFLGRIPALVANEILKIGYEHEIESLTNKRIDALF